MGLNISSGHNWGGSFLSVEITDERPIRALVAGLEDFDKDKALTEGLKKGAGIFSKKGKQNLRKRLSGKQSSGNLLGSFRVYSSPRLLRAKAGFSSEGSHAHLVDLGTVSRYTKGKGRYKKSAYRGIMPSNQFWTDARQSEEHKAENAIYEGVRQAVQRLEERRL